RKSVTMTSLKEKVKERSAAEMSPGMIFGTVTRRNVVISSAPRFIAASSMERSNSFKLTISTTMTMGMQKVTWPTMMDDYHNNHWLCVYGPRYRALRKAMNRRIEMPR